MSKPLCTVLWSSRAECNAVCINAVIADLLVAVAKYFTRSSRTKERFAVAPALRIVFVMTGKVWWQLGKAWRRSGRQLVTSHPLLESIE